MTCVRDCSTHNATKNVEYTILFNELILIVVMYRPQIVSRGKRGEMICFDREVFSTCCFRRRLPQEAKPFKF